MVNIRRATPADLPDVQRLNQALFQYEHDHQLYPDETYNLNWSYEPDGIKYLSAALGDSPDSAVFVAEIGGHIIGYVAASCFTRPYRTQNPICYLDNMFVEPEHRRHQAGTQLVGAFKDWARTRHAARIQVGAFTANHQAIKFYRRQGFTDFQVYLEQPAGE